MPHPYTTLFFWTLPTFTVLIGFGAVFILLIALYLTRHDIPSGKTVDIAIGGLIGAAVLARTFHVLLDWSYFSAHNEEIFRFPAGGLNWHGALIGALIGTSIVGWWRKVPFKRILDMMVIGLPLMMFAAWWGCGAAACAYGAEIQNLSQYPSWLVWEERDIYGLIYPRYATQPVGMMVAAALLVLGIWMAWRGWRTAPGIMLLMVSLSMLLIGFLRGDVVPIYAGLRIDQWLDLFMIMFALGLTGYTLYVRTHDLRLPEPSPQR